MLSRSFSVCVYNIKSKFIIIILKVNLLKVNLLKVNVNQSFTQRFNIVERRRNENLKLMEMDTLIMVLEILLEASKLMSPIVKLCACYND